mmetsp:Transcript_86002/g.229518  ORF Transcript_86002/g.229518 Transcript_86002/m.229518 type:complete len:106 (-) Transcript_86002:7-324(-)
MLESHELDSDTTQVLLVADERHASRSLSDDSLQVLSFHLPIGTATSRSPDSGKPCTGSLLEIVRSLDIEHIHCFSAVVPSPNECAASSRVMWKNDFKEYMIYYQR